MKNNKGVFFAVLVAIIGLPCYGQVIETIAGGGERALNLPLDQLSVLPGSPVVAPDGTLFFRDFGSHVKFDPKNMSIELLPDFIKWIDAVDEDGNYYRWDAVDFTIIKQNPVTGDEEIIAGIPGERSHSPDGESVISSLDYIFGELWVKQGFLYFIENTKYFRRIDLENGILETIFEASDPLQSINAFAFNNETAKFYLIGHKSNDPPNQCCGDNVLLHGDLDTRLVSEIQTLPYGASTGLAVDWQGNIVLSQREVPEVILDPATGTVIGNFDDLAKAANIVFCNLDYFVSTDLADQVLSDSQGNLFIIYSGARAMIYLSPDGFQRVGNQAINYFGDNGPAIHAGLSYPNDIEIDDNGTIYINDSENNLVRRINQEGIIEKFIGKINAGDDPEIDHCFADYFNIFLLSNNQDILAWGGDDDYYFLEKFTTATAEREFVQGFSSFEDFYASKFDLGIHDEIYLLGTEVGVQKNREYHTLLDNSMEYDFRDITYSDSGVIYISLEVYGERVLYIYKYDLNTGSFEKYAGSSQSTAFRNGMPADEFGFGENHLQTMEADDNGNLYISFHDQIYIIVASDRRMYHVAGNGITGFSGDGGDPLNASFHSIADIELYNGDIFIADQSNHRIRKISGYEIPKTPRPSIAGFTLVNPRTDQEIRELEALDYWFLPDLWRINVIAEPVDPTLVQSVTYRVDGKYDHTENAYPYALGGDDAGDYREWSAGNGVYNICATPYSLPHRQGTEGEEKCITLSLIFTLPAMMEGSGEIYSARGSYVTMPDAEGATFYDFTAYYDHATEEFSGWASVEFPDAGLMFTSSTPHHFFQRTTRAHLFWDGMLNGEEGYRMDQYLGYRPARTDTRIIIRHISTGEIIYDSEVTIAADETNQLSAPLWTELNGSGDAVLEASIDAVHVGPNPFSDRIALALPMNDTGNAARVTLTDLQGRVIYDGTAMPGAVSQIETSGLNSGMYILSLKDGEREKTFKVVKD